MTAERKIEVAQELLTKAREEDGRKKATADEIKNRKDWIVGVIEGNPEGTSADARIAACNTYLKEIVALESDKKRQAKRAKNLRSAMENCVMGTEEFDSAQLDFDGIAEGEG